MAAENRGTGLTLPFNRASDTNWSAAHRHHMSVAATPPAYRRGTDVEARIPMWISTAYAQGTGIFDQNALVQFLPLILIFVVFYFLLIRPQQRKAKDHKTMLDALRRGDRVVTGGGIIGTVARVDNPEEVIVDIAENVRVRVLRSTITSVVAKPDPAAAREAAKQKTEARAKVGTKE